LIVRDEEALLPDALRSVSFADELIVGIDSRTTDRTEEIARSFGAKIHEFEWQDDFSKARNIGIRKARKDFILIIDADDRITDWGKATIREVLRQPRRDVDVYGLLIENRKLDGTLLKVDPLPSVRLFPNHQGIRYHNRVHEVLKGNKPLQIGWLRGGMAITHYGYDPNLYKQKGKDARNLGLLEQELFKERPKDRLLAYELARQHVIGGRKAEAYIWARYALTLPGYLRPELTTELERIVQLDTMQGIHT